MASTFVPLPVPQVPDVAGVPALFASGSPLAAVGLAFTGLSSLGGAFQTTWGIFNSGGSPILTADAVGSVEFMQDFRISDYPQEQGAFESYNKVQIPFQAKVTYLLNEDRASFLQGIFAQLYSLDFVTVVTPEISYPSANLTHCAYRRTAKDGVTLIAVEVWCEEVRIASGSSTLSNTASQNGEDASNDGTVQADQTTPGSTDPVTGNLNSGLPSFPSATPSTSLPSPNIPSAFYNANNLPEVPNEVANLNGAQQTSAISYSQQLGVSSSTVYQPPTGAGSGNITPDNSYMTIESIDITP